MKRHANLYEKIITKDNIELAIQRSSKGKRHRKDVQFVLNNKNNCIVYVYDLLLNKSYRFKITENDKKIIWDNSSEKYREIYKPKFFPDQIIHQSLLNIIAPLIQNSLIFHTCASIPGRGTDYAKRVISKWVKEDWKGTKYCLKIDIRKFYDSIDHKNLIHFFNSYIKCDDTISIITSIIKSKDSGLPIGYNTSQWFANFYLMKFDHYIKEVLKVKYYARYMDDMLFFLPNKKQLHELKRLIEDLLRNFFALNIKSNWCILKPTKEGVNFLGYRFFRRSTIIKKKTYKNIRRTCNDIKITIINNGTPEHTLRSFISYNGILKNTDSFYFNQKYITHYFSKKKVFKLCARFDKR